MRKVKIVPIPTKMEKFYGSGSMLHPELDQIKDTIAKIPKGKVASIDTLGSFLAKEYGTDVTCPMRLGNGIKKLSKESLDREQAEVPFWRVIKKDKKMIKSK